MLVLTLLSQIIVTGPALLIVSALTMATGGLMVMNQSMLTSAIQSIAGLTLSLMAWTPLQLIAITLLYFDLRVAAKAWTWRSNWMSRSATRRLPMKSCA